MTEIRLFGSEEELMEHIRKQEEERESSQLTIPKAIVHRNVCRCHTSKKRFVGDIGSEMQPGVGIYICDSHSTIMKHLIVTGEVYICRIL